ncbi:MAG: UbiH/UbiF/VisC/COQ6 family ubiquinone biosynthesis hydroxylase [Acidithiobacillus sp.]
MSDSLRNDLVVSGGGMVGASLALAVCRMGLRVRLFERRSREDCRSADPYERASLVSLGSGRFLAGIGIDVAALGTPVARMRVWDGQGFGSIHLDAEDGGEMLLGHIVENRRLEQALHEAICATGETVLHYAEELVETVPCHREIALRSKQGSSLSTTLLAIAEGRQSPLRKQVTNAPLFREDYGQDGITATVWMEKPHRHVAYQRFLDSGPLAILPFGNDHDGRPRASMVWSAKRPLARRLMAMDDDAFLAALNQAFGPQLGRFYQIGPRAAFPLSGLHSSRYISQRAVLLGDSAHGVHPLAGLGVNLGLRDAETLAKLIGAAIARQEDWGEPATLRCFQAQRRPDNLATVLACGGLSHLFSNNHRGLAALRDAGMFATGFLFPLKRFLIRQAMGL